MSTKPARRTSAWIACLALAALALGGCGGKDDKSSASGASTVVEGKLTVCSNPPYPPFELTENGKLVGFDLDIMAEVANDLDLELSGRETPFEAIESAAALDAGDCDVGASALTITDARAQKADFSDSYYDTSMGMLTSADSGITDAANLEGKMIGVQQGTTGEKWAKEHLQPDQIRQYEHLGDQTTALLAGDVDGVINDVPTLEPYKTDGFTIIGGLSESEVFGFMVAKGNTELASQINTTLARIKSDGTYDKLVDKWFTDYVPETE